MERSKSSSHQSVSFHQKNNGKIPKIPVEPLLAFQATEKSSKLFNELLEAAKYPPLMQPQSWTRAVPFKVVFPAH